MITTERPLCHECGERMVREPGCHRCPKCGATSGETPAPTRCGRCDRPDCPRAAAWVAWATCRLSTSPDLDREEELHEVFNKADDDCHAHAVDWKGRAIAAESALVGARVAVEEAERKWHRNGFEAAIGEVKKFSPAHVSSSFLVSHLRASLTRLEPGAGGCPARRAGTEGDEPWLEVPYCDGKTHRVFYEHTEESSPCPFASPARNPVGADLTSEGFARVMEMVENPPPPTEKLREAFKKERNPVGGEGPAAELGMPCPRCLLTKGTTCTCKPTKERAR